MFPRGKRKGLQLLRHQARAPPHHPAQLLHRPSCPWEGQQKGVQGCPSWQVGPASCLSLTPGCQL